MSLSGVGLCGRGQVLTGQTEHGAAFLGWGCSGQGGILLLPWCVGFWQMLGHWKTRWECSLQSCVLELVLSMCLSTLVLALAVAVGWDPGPDVGPGVVGLNKARERSSGAFWRRCRWALWC